MPLHIEPQLLIVIGGYKESVSSAATATLALPYGEFPDPPTIGENDEATNNVMARRKKKKGQAEEEEGYDRQWFIPIIKQHGGSGCSKSTDCVR
jgi:hypothetical protein